MRRQIQTDQRVDVKVSSPCRHQDHKCVTEQLECLLEVLEAGDVDEERTRVKESYGYEDANVINFELDGKVYRALEDPSDGYRSSCRSLTVIRRKVRHLFGPVEVLGVYKNRTTYGGEADIIQFYDTANGKLVLEVGTDNTDDSYPSFVASFTPENMHVNARVSDDKEPTQPR